MRVSDEDRNAGYPWGRPMSNAFADRSPHHEHVSEDDKKAGYPWGRPKADPIADHSSRHEHVSEEEEWAWHPWGRPKPQQPTGLVDSYPKQSAFIRELRSYEGTGIAPQYSADTSTSSRFMHGRTPSPSIRTRSYLTDDEGDLPHVLHFFSDAYSTLIFALLYNYRSRLTREQGRHFDHADDSIVSAFAHAHEFDWCTERLVHLKIGQKETMDKAGATSWSIPVPFLGLPESVLEVFFPLDAVAVSKLTNDVLRVLHVRLDSTARNLAGASDADMAASRKVVLEELQRRGFKSRASTYAHGLSHLDSDQPTISDIDSERFNSQKSFKRRATNIKRALRLHRMATWPSLDEDLTSEVDARYEISFDRTALVTHYEGPVKSETCKDKAPMTDDRLGEVMSSTASVTSFWERLHTPEEEGFEHRHATVADGNSSTEDEDIYSVSEKGLGKST